MFERLASPSWRSSVLAEVRFGPKALRGTVPWLLRTRLRQIDSLLQVALKNAAVAPTHVTCRTRTRGREYVCDT